MIRAGAFSRAYYASMKRFSERNPIIKPSPHPEDREMNIGIVTSIIRSFGALLVLGGLSLLWGSVAAIR
jgi:hypothetical protein